MSGWLRRLSIALTALLVVMAAADADAQRRRGRRGRRAARAVAAAPQSTDTGGASGAGEEAGAGPDAPVATGEAAPPATTPPATTAPSAPAAAQAAAEERATSGSDTNTGAGAGAPVAGDADPGPMPPDLSGLRQEYVQLMDEMVQARSRVAIVGQELFRSRMTVTVQDRTGDEQTLTRFVLELDGTPVHRTDGELEGGDQGRRIFEGALAPGPHVLTLDVEQRAREDTEYRTTQRESFRFVVVRDRLTEVTIVLEDDSDIARELRSGGEGRFEIRTRVRVAIRELPRS